MENYEDNRSPEEIERDIERTRSQMAGTLDDIQRRFSPGQMVDQALGYLNEKSGQVGPRVMDTIRDNPVPITLVGVGLAWLATAGWSGSQEQRSSRSRYSTTGSRVSGGPGYGSRHGESGGYRERSRSMAGTAGYGGGYGASMPEQAMGERAFTERRIGGDRRSNGSAHASGGTGATWSGPERRHGERRTRHMGQQISESMGQAKHRMGEAMDTMQHKASEMQHKASETAGEMRQKAGQVLGQAREKAHEWTEQAREKTHEWTDEAREQAQWVEQKFREQARFVIEEQPLILGALGIAIGAAIGASLPRTRQEDRLMGPARDDLLHKADETGGEFIREAREQVRSGMESMTAGMESMASAAEGSLEERSRETERRGTERAESSSFGTGSSSGTSQSGQTGTTGMGGERIPTTPGGGSETRRP